MKSPLQSIVLTLALVPIAVFSATAVAHSGHALHSVDKVTATREAERDLWSNHIFWVRNVVFATNDKNVAERKTAEAQVVANAKAIAASIAPFYGQAASDQLFTLLAGHWGAIKGYLDATYAGDKAAATKSMNDLDANAVAIATFLSGANPNLPKATLVSLLKTHGAQHIEQIEEVHAGRFDQEAMTWAAMRTHMNVIADALADAIAKQFPDKF
jgi:hypothetical protein